jgi:outer membrane protein TolC
MNKMRIQQPLILGELIICIAALGRPATLRSEVLMLGEAIKMAEENNRGILIAAIERTKAGDEVDIARTYRWPVFSVTALGSQSLSRLGLTFDQGSLGVYPTVGPIPGETTTLESPLQPAAIVYASVAQPLTQQHRIGLSIQLAHVGVQAAEEQVRLKRQSTANEVRRVYYGILQLESSKKSLDTTIAFLTQLDREITQETVQRVALRADALDVKAQLAQAEYALLKLTNPLETQKQELNRLMGREPDTDFEVDPLAATDFMIPTLKEAYAKALEARPEARLANLQVRKAELERRIKNAERIPDVSLTVTTLATANISNSLPRNLSFAGVQATWDVHDWGRKRKQVDQKRLAEEQASLELKEAKAKIMVEVANQYRRLLEARKELEVANLSQSAAAEQLRVARNRYSVREVLLSDVLKVQSRLADADHRRTQARLDLATAQADFEKALGEEP